MWALVEYTAYACVRNGLPAGTVGCHSAATKYYHRMVKGFDLDMDHPLIQSTLQGLNRSHAVVGTQQQVRRPVSLSVLLHARSLSAAWGFGGEVLWLGLCSSFFFSIGSSEIFADITDVLHPVYCLRRHDVAFFGVRGNCGLRRGGWQIMLRCVFGVRKVISFGAVPLCLGYGLVLRCRCSVGAGRWM